MLPIGLATGRPQKHPAPYRLGKLQPCAILRVVDVLSQISPRPWIRRSRCLLDVRKSLLSCALHTLATAFAAFYSRSVNLPM